MRITQIYRLLMWATVAAVICGGMVGCASDKRGKALQATTALYQSNIRWNQFRDAVKFTEPETRPKFEEMELMMRRYDQIKVTSYIVVTEGPGPGVDQYRQRVEIRFVNRHNMRERVITDMQIWQYYPEREQWLLTTGLPDITRS